MPYPQQWLCEELERAAGCRAYPASVPEVESVPYVTFEHTRTDFDRSLDGTCNVATQSYTVTVYAPTYLESQRLGRLVRMGVDNFTGSVGGVTITHCHIEDERDGQPVDFAGDGKPTYAKELVFLVRFFEG